MYQKGFIQLLLILPILIILGIVVYFVYTINVSKSNIAIAPKAQYQNPLDKSSQYTNPFSETKNPFDNLK